MKIVYPIYMGFPQPVFLECRASLFFKLTLPKGFFALLPQWKDQFVLWLQDRIQGKVTIDPSEEEEEDLETYLFQTNAVSSEDLASEISTFFETRPSLWEGFNLLTIRTEKTFYRFFSKNLGIIMEGPSREVAFLHLFQNSDQKSQDLDSILFRGVKAAADFPYASKSLQHLGSLIVPKQKQDQEPDQEPDQESDPPSQEPDLTKRN